MTNGIIIPCYNESSRLDIQSYLNYATENKDTLLCFVNDGSSDATRSTLANIKSQEYDNIHIYNLNENGGKARAVQQGALYLYNETEVETIGFIDADLSTDFNDYRRLLDTFQKDRSIRVIYGSRAQSGENNIERKPIRALISSIIRLLIFFITRLNIKDTQCGAKVFDRDLILDLFTKDFKTRWLFDVEILLRLKKKYGIASFRSLFREQPLLSWVHMEGSKLGAKDAIKIPIQLLNIWFKYNIVDGIYRNIIMHLEVSLHRLQGKGLIPISIALLSFTEEVTVYFAETFGYSYLQFALPVILLTHALSKSIRPAIVRGRRYRWIQAHVNTHKRRLFNI